MSSSTRESSTTYRETMRSLEMRRDSVKRLSVSFSEMPSDLSALLLYVRRRSVSTGSVRFVRGRRSTDLVPTLFYKGGTASATAPTTS